MVIAVLEPQHMTRLRRSVKRLSSGCTSAEIGVGNTKILNCPQALATEACNSFLVARPGLTSTNSLGVVSPVISEPVDHLQRR